MQKFSIHTHTVGYDGKNTVAEMIQHAIKLKWEAISAFLKLLRLPEIYLSTAKTSIKSGFC